MHLSPLVRHFLPLLVLVSALAGTPPVIEKNLHVWIPMRDGARLCANIFRPAQTSHLPAILIRTPYGKSLEAGSFYQVFANYGYAVVVQDVRGRYHSDGEFEALDQEPADGDDTLNWIAGRKWSNGKVGMIGGSYLGIVQWKVAPLNNPHLRAIFPVVSGNDEYFDRFYSRGGAIKLGHRLLWLSENLLVPGMTRPAFNKFVYHMPLRTSDRAATGRTIDWFQRALDHPSYDAYWKGLSIRDKLARIQVPVFSVGGWYDNYVQSDLEAFSELQKHSSLHRILIGPWPHNMSQRFPAADFGPEAMVPIRKLQLAWFDYWLKTPDPVPAKAPAIDGPPVRIFIMGINRWRDEREWPLARARETAFYLGSDGHANGLAGNGSLHHKPRHREPADQFVYNPAHPVPTQGGSVCCNSKIFPWGPMDQSTVEARQDVLVYTTRPMKHDLEVTGPIRVVLYASTSAPDTDFTAKLVDVFPDGRAINLTDGILRLRYRNSLEKATLAHPGEVYQISIDAGVTSNVFLAGHRIRLEISSSNFPRFDRNPNTGRPIAEETELRPANQTIYHNEQFPSAIVLPVIPRENDSMAASRWLSSRR